MRLAGRKLDTTEVEEFAQILQEIFAQPAKLAALAHSIGIPLDAPTPRQLVDTAEARGQTAELLNAARASRPDSAQLLALAQRYGLPQLPHVLERNISTVGRPQDIVPWMAKFAAIQRATCRIKYRYGHEERQGTGFLIGPSAVMTCYHVLQPVLDGDIPPREVEFHFDDYMLLEGTRINSDRIYRMTSDKWLIQASPPSELDTITNTAGREPTHDELDYVVVGMARDPGLELIVSESNVASGSEPPRRGWIGLPNDVASLDPGSMLCIVHHPEGDTLKISLDSTVERLNNVHTRLHYTTATAPGSSGAPCFNHQLDLVAIHQSSNPNYGQAYKQGIPIAAIVGQLRQHNKLVEIQRRRAPVERITAAEYLLQFGFRFPSSRGQTEELFSGFAENESEDVTGAFIADVQIEGINGNIQTFRQLALEQSFVLFAGRGCGKTSGRRDIRRRASEQAHLLVVDIHLPELLPRPELAQPDSYLRMILKTAGSQIQARFEEKPYDLEKLHRQLPKLSVFYSSLETMMADHTASIARIFPHAGPGHLLDLLMEVARVARYTKMIVLVDSAEELLWNTPQREDERMLKALRPLFTSAALLRASDVIFKCFLPASLDRPMRERLRAWNVLPIYRLHRWGDADLLRMLWRRMEFYSGVTSFAELCCDPNDAADADEQLVSATLDMDGSPRTLLNLVRHVIDYHCKDLAERGAAFDAPINVAAIRIVIQQVKREYRHELR